MIPLPTIPPMPSLLLPGYGIRDQAAMTNPEPQDGATPSALKLTTSYADPVAELRNMITGMDPTTLALLSQVLQHSRESRAVNLEHKKPEIESKITATTKQQLTSATSSP
jgi:hypothetical protein